MDWSVRKGRLEELDRHFDYEYWQKKTPTERFAAAWELVLNYHVGILEEDEDKLRLQRSIGSIQPRES